MADPTIRIMVKADTKQAESSLGGLKGTLGKLGGIAGTAGKAMLGIGAAAGGAAIAAAAGIGKLAMDAAQVQGVKQTFDNLAESIGTTADILLGKMREATRGMVSDVDLMQAGNKFLAMGLADTEEEAAALAEMATQLGMAMGEDATASMENFALMLANQSIPRLDSFGISSGKVRERIEELMEADKDLTREQAFMQAVMEQGGATMEKVGDQTNNAAGRMAQLKASMENSKIAIGEAFLPILEKLLGAFATLVEEWGPKIVAFAQGLGQWFMDAWATVEPIVAQIVGWFKQEGPSAISEFKDKAIAFLQPAIDFMRGQFEKIVGWVRENWPLIQATIARVMETVRNVIETVLGAIRKFWEDHGAKIMQYVGNMWEIIKTIVETTINTVLGIIKAVMQLITGDWEGAWETIKGVAENAWEAIKRIVGLAIENIGIILQTGIAVIKGIWDRAWEWLKNAGASIVEGLKSGISNAWDGFVNWVIGLLGGLKTKILEFFGIESPSKMFAEIGKNLMSGLAEGIGGGLEMPVTAMVQAGSAVQYAAAASTGGTTNNYNLTINTSAQAESALSDFHTMRALAGV